MKMSTPRVWLRRVPGVFGKERRDRDLAEELESHLRMHIEDNVRAGMAPEDARRHAIITLGGVEQTKENCRDRRGLPWVETLLQNVRFGLRMLRKNPGFTAVAILTLALGIGATTAIFTAAYATLLAPLPYPQSDRLVNVWSNLQGHRTWVSAGDFVDWKRQSTAFEDLNAGSTDDFNVATQDRPEFFDGMEATPGYYRMLGIHLFLGRNFLPEEGEPGKEHVVILTHRLWQHLGANPKIIGQTNRNQQRAVYRRRRVRAGRCRSLGLGIDRAARLQARAATRSRFSRSGSSLAGSSPASPSSKRRPKWTRSPQRKRGTIPRAIKVGARS